MECEFTSDSGTDFELVGCIQIVENRFLKGPNIHSLNPVAETIIKLDKDYEKSRILVNILKTFEDYIHEFEEVQINNEDEKRDVVVPYKIAELLILLQKAVGSDVKFYTCNQVDKGVWKMAVQYEHEKLFTKALERTVELLNMLVAQEKQFSFKELFEELIIYLKEIYAEVELGPSTRALVNAASAKDIPYEKLEDDFSIFSFGWGKHRKMIWGPVTSNTSLLVSDLVTEKDLTKQVLQENGFPVPEGYVVRSLGDAIKKAKELRFPLVVKPVDSHHGHGVIVNIRSEEELKQAFNTAKTYSYKVIIERYLNWDDFRFLLVDNKVVAVSKRIPAHVVGDGHSTVRELIEKENMNPKRGEGHGSVLTNISMGEEESICLKKYGYTFESIPKKGEIVYLREIANMSSGGTSENYTDLVHPSIKRAVERASKLLSMDVMGIDVVAEDLTLPVTQSKWAIIEINASPGLRMHLEPVKGNPIPVGKYILESMYPEGNGRIPLVAVTGTNGKTTTSRLIEWIARNQGYHTGMAVTGGIWLMDEQLEEGDTTGPRSAKIILRNPEVDFAVLETARGGIIRKGLGFDKCKVSVLTNIREDHLGLDGIETKEDLYRIKSVLLKATDPSGYCVINGNDEFAERAVHDARGTPIIFSVRMNGFVNMMIEKGLTVFLYEEGSIWLIKDKKPIEALNVYEIPFLMGGVEMLVENTLAAMAAAYSLGMPIEMIKKALPSFKMNEEMNPGRLNMVKVGEIPVVLDYAHNCDCLRALGEYASHLKGEKKILVFAGVGDRKDEALRKCSLEAMRWFDEIIFTENPLVLRGREIGEMTNIMKKAAMDNGSNVKVINKMEDAIVKAIDSATPHDVVFLTDLDIDTNDLRGIVGDLIQDNVKPVKVSTEQNLTQDVYQTQEMCEEEGK